MSLEKLPKLSRPLFKNMLEKQQISHRMHIHKQKINKVERSKSKFTIDLHNNPNFTYRQLFEQNPKRNRMLETKYMEIERQNKYLFQKISKAHKSKKSKSPNRSLQRIKSMNITMRRKQIQEIQIQNVKLLNRISSQKPSINFKQTDKEYIKQRRFSQKLSNIEKYKFEDWY